MSRVYILRGCRSVGCRLSWRSATPVVISGHRSLLAASNQLTSTYIVRQENESSGCVEQCEVLLMISAHQCLIFLVGIIEHLEDNSFTSRMTCWIGPCRNCEFIAEKWQNNSCIIVYGCIKASQCSGVDPLGSEWRCFIGYEHEFKLSFYKAAMIHQLIRSY